MHVRICYYSSKVLQSRTNNQTWLHWAVSAGEIPHASPPALGCTRGRSTNDAQCVNSSFHHAVKGSCTCTYQGPAKYLVPIKIPTTYPSGAAHFEPMVTFRSWQQKSNVHRRYGYHYYYTTRGGCFQDNILPAYTSFCHKSREHTNIAV